MSDLQGDVEEGTLQKRPTLDVPCCSMKPDLGEEDVSARPGHPRQV